MAFKDSQASFDQPNLDRFVEGLTIKFLNLAECSISPGWRLSFPGGETAAMHYNLEGCGNFIVGAFPPIRLLPHTFVIEPAMIPFRIEGDVPRGAKIKQVDAEYPSGGSSRVSKYIAGENKGGILLVCGYIRTLYGKSFDIFDNLTSPIVEQFDEDDNLDSSLKSALSELIAEEVGMGAMTASLVKEVLVKVLRRSLKSPERWLERFPAFSDQRIARALADMIAEPGAPHTVQSLANTAGLSRSRFMHRFVMLVGMSPVMMLRQLRMREAAHFLKSDYLPIHAIARAVGYETVAGFSRAFRAEFGVDPVDYRGSNRSSDGMGWESG